MLMVIDIMNFKEVKMKKKTIIIALTFLEILFLVGCGNKDNYDWKNVDPGKQIITGNNYIRGNNTTIYDYLAIPRGGSIFTWASSASFLTIEPDSKYPYLAHIKANTTSDATVMLYVTETTWGGKISKDTLNLFVEGFCPFDINQLIGGTSVKYTCSEMNYVPFSVNLNTIGSDTVLLDNFSNNGWQLKYVLSGDIYESIKIADNHYSYNGEPVIVKGFGTYNTCKGVLTVNFAVVRPTGDTVLNSDNTIYAGVDKFTR